MVAPLSFTSTYGYYGLRVNPTFEKVVGTVRNPLRIPLPDRKAKWYALSPYRALILDAEQKYQDFEHASVDYRGTGAELPEAAARVRSSDAGDDPQFERIHRHGERMDEQDAYEAAFDLMNQEHRAQTQETRHEQLSTTYAPNRMHPVIEASTEELTEAGMPHALPARIPMPPRRVWHTPPEQYAAAGQLQAREFPSFEALNLGQTHVRAATLTPAQNMTYERARDLVVGPTWSS